jgi:hypothetical protein
MRHLPLVVLAALALPAAAAELKFDFSRFPENQPPPGFRSLVAGEGRPGDWRMVLDEVPPLLAPLSDKAPVVTRRAVLAQLAQDPTDERFPILVYEGETFTDFTLTTRFKTVRGEREQMAGVVFRLQDERNFYVVRASALGNTFRFYKVVDGQRSTPIGPQIEIAGGVWHELTVACKGTQIRCLLNGREAIPPLGDTSFARGRIGFWTKSDAVSYFADTRVTYTAAEVLAQKLVRDALAKYPRLRGLKIHAIHGDVKTPRVVASGNAADLGQTGGQTEAAVIAQGTPYYVKDRKNVSVILPLRDRNGDPIAAVRVTMESFMGQTEQNALVRALPIVKQMQARVTTLEDLLQ